MNRRKVRILVIEDDKEITRILRRILAAHGYEVLITHSGEQALEVFEQQSPDLLLLDLGLPNMSGLDVCKQVRTRSKNLPIIVLSVRNTEGEKVQVLDLGADDYITKPFGMDEILARIRVAMRRTFSTQEIEPLLTLGPLEINFALQTVSLDGQPVKLTPTEYDLLKILVEQRGKILTQPMLLSEVWRSDQKKQAYLLHVFVGQLRRKIEPDPVHPRFLETIIGVGYRFQYHEGEEE